jgi:hypothetical protein
METENWHRRFEVEKIKKVKEHKKERENLNYDKKS